MSGVALMRRAAFDPEQVNLIRATVAKDCNDAELALFLEVCAAHELDPFIKEIWAYKIKGRVVTVVSRDGLLKIANRCTGKGWGKQPGEFLGCQSDAVHEHDSFVKEVTIRKDGSEKITARHVYQDAEGKPTHGGKDGELRGMLIGSWATVRRRGHDDAYYFAYRDEYDKAENVWKSHPHAMMIKVAEAMALRKAFSIAGVVGEGEVERAVNITASAEDSGPDIRWPEDEELAEKLRAGFHLLGYRRAKVRSLVNACGSLEEFGALLGRLNGELDAAAAAEEEVDGEVVA